MLRLAREDGVPVTVVCSDNDLNVQGVNTPQQLETLERRHQRVLADDLMTGGVLVADRSRLDIRGRLQCGHDVSIDVNVLFEGDVALGDGVSIGANCIVRDAAIGAGAQILPFSHIEGAEVQAGAVIGPLCATSPRCGDWRAG